MLCRFNQHEMNMLWKCFDKPGVGSVVVCGVHWGSDAMNRVSTGLPVFWYLSLLFFALAPFYILHLIFHISHLP